MKSELKDGMYTSTQASEVLAMNVETLRDWQRKNYFPLPDTGGWQRYREQDLFLIFTMDYMLDAGLNHELAISIAKHAYPLYEMMRKNTQDGVLVEDHTFRLLVKPFADEDGKASFELVKGFSGFEYLNERGGRLSRVETVNLLIDFRVVLEELDWAINHFTYTDGPLRFWKSKEERGE